MNTDVSGELCASKAFQVSPLKKKRLSSEQLGNANFSFSLRLSLQFDPKLSLEKNYKHWIFEGNLVCCCFTAEVQSIIPLAFFFFN